MSSGVVTPEAVLLELPVAGVASRVLARLVDLALQVVLATILVTVGGLGVPGASPVLLAVVIGFVVMLVAPITTEILWRGRSPGKALVGLRVVGVDGGPELPRQALVRGLVALVDLCVSLGSVALAAAMASPSVQRAGDMAAGTLVIRVRGRHRLVVPVAFLPPPSHEAYVASLDVGRLDDEDFSLVRETLLRVGGMERAARTAITTQLADDVARRIRHTPPGPIDPELWLVCVASAYQQRNGGLLADAAAGLAPVAAPTARR